jgi:hypothetical protein
MVALPTLHPRQGRRVWRHDSTDRGVSAGASASVERITTRPQPFSRVEPTLHRRSIEKVYSERRGRRHQAITSWRARRRWGYDLSFLDRVRGRSTSLWTLGTLREAPTGAARFRTIWKLIGPRTRPLCTGETAVFATDLPKPLIELGLPAFHLPGRG